MAHAPVRAQAHLLVKDLGLRLPRLLDGKDAVEKLLKKKVFSIGPKRAADIKAGWDANPRGCARTPPGSCLAKSLTAPATHHWTRLP